MIKPEEEQMQRAAAAFHPFVRRWNLPLNPEDMDEIAYAILLHACSDADLHGIAEAVEKQIDEHEAAARRMFEAMQAQIDRQRPGSAERLGTSANRGQHATRRTGSQEGDV